ncbi:MAG: ABC transporter permease [Bacteroidota bacterium]
MDKILLILSREYVSRVKKKSFLLTTFLTPLLIGGLYAVAIYFAVSDTEEKVIKVIDETGIFSEKIEDRNSVKFEFVTEGIESARENVEKGSFDGLLYIKELDVDKPEGIKYYSMSTPGVDLIRGVNRSLEQVVRNVKIEKMGFSKTALDSLYTDINVETINLSGEKEKSGNAAVAMGVGSFSGILIYMFMLIYGAQVMRGVMQEKTSKIVEILVSSVRPFQLMMGKILGVAAVGLTQFVLWIVLTVSVISIANPLLGGDSTVQEMAAGQTEMIQSQEEQNEILAVMNTIEESINIPLIIGAFFFYFLTGYLFYAALFAMVGSAIDSEADSQQFMMPIMLPLIASMMFIGVIIKDPSGPIAFWMSIIPFFSPIIMMLRLPFDVPLWELILSMALMVVGFIGTTWIAGRVYRIGILMYGSKVNYKVLFKWMMMKN